MVLCGFPFNLSNANAVCIDTCISSSCCYNQSEMSRFWQQDSSSEDESSDNESVAEKQPVNRQAANERRFASTYVDDSDSESDNEIRVVRSQKDRAFITINEIVAKFQNARKTNDWPVIQEVFLNANKQIEKSRVLINQYGYPPAYIKMLAEMEDHVQLTLGNKEAIKKYKPPVAKAFNQMKLQIRKHNEGYKTEITDFREHPEKYEEAKEENDSSSSSDDSSDSDSDSDSDSSDSDSDSSKSSMSSSPVAKVPSKPPKNDFDSDSDFDAPSDDESSSDEEEDGRQVLTGRARWLKKVVTAAPVSKPKQAAAKPAAKVQVETEGLSAPVVVARPVVVVSLTAEELDSRVTEIVSQRGRKAAEAGAKDALRQMEALSNFARAHGPQREINVLMHLISMRLESIRSIDDYLDHAMWRCCERNISRVLSLLESNTSMRLAALGGEDPTELSLAYLKPTTSADNVTSNNIVRVVGSIESFVSRLADEYTKAVQQINPHTKEYVARLNDEPCLVELLKRALQYYKRVSDKRCSATLALMIVEHIYYMHETHAVSVDQAYAFQKKFGAFSDIHPASRGRYDLSDLKNNKNVHPAALCGPASVGKSDSVALDYSVYMEELCAFVFKESDVALQKTRALLCLVYHHALHDRYYAARDLFLLSHVNDFIEKAEVRTQVLYNRTLAVMGMAAFRLGLYQKAHDLLSPLCFNPRWKELLAQGTQRVNNNDVGRDLAAEREEKRRQLPYHMHVNPDLLEATHLTCAMLLELPQLARLGNSPSVNIQAQPGIISKVLRKHLQSYRRQAFTGPPETVREHVLSATEHILAGRWKEACNVLLERLEVWSFIPGPGAAHKVRQALQQRIQEEAVRCHLLQSYDMYDDVALAQLAETFDLSVSTGAATTTLGSSGSGAQIRRIVCRMIFQKELSASLQSNAQNEDILVFHRSEQSLLQGTAQATGEKLTGLLDSSERVLDNCAGGLYNFKDDWQQKDGHHKSGGMTSGGYHKSQDHHRRSGGKAGHSRGPRPVVLQRNQNNSHNRQKNRFHASNNTNNSSNNNNSNSNGYSGNGNPNNSQRKSAWGNKPAN